MGWKHQKAATIGKLTDSLELILDKNIYKVLLSQRAGAWITTQLRC